MRDHTTPGNQKKNVLQAIAAAIVPGPQPPFAAKALAFLPSCRSQNENCCFENCESGPQRPARAHNTENAPSTSFVQDVLQVAGTSSRANGMRNNTICAALALRCVLAYNP